MVGPAWAGCWQSNANCKMPLMPFFHICDPVADKKAGTVPCPHPHTELTS